MNDFEKENDERGRIRENPDREMRKEIWDKIEMGEKFQI